MTDYEDVDYTVEGTTAVITMASAVTVSMIVARAFTAGVMPKRTAEYSTIGHVFVVPLVNAGST